MEVRMSEREGPDKTNDRSEGSEVKSKKQTVGRKTDKWVWRE